MSITKGGKDRAKYWMRAERVLMLIVLALAGCGESDPTETGFPSANLVAEEGGAFSSCTSFISIPNDCDFVGEGRNLGPGCADTIRGVTKFYDASGTQLGAAESWSFFTFIVVQPGEAFTYEIRNVRLEIVDAFASFTSEVSWANIRC